MSYALPNTERTLGFMGLSSLLHVALFVATSMMMILAPKPKPAEVITIEIQSLPKASGGLSGLSSGPAGALAPSAPAPKKSSINRQAARPASRAGKAQRSHLQTANKSHDAVVIPVQKHARQALAKAAKAPRNPVVSPRKAATPKIAKASPVQKTGPVVLPNVDFDQALHEEISDLDEKDFQDDFDKADKMAVKHLAKKSDSEIKQLEKEFQISEESQKRAASDLEKDIQEQNALMEKRSKDRLQQSMAQMEKQAAAQAAAEAAAQARLAAENARQGGAGSGSSKNGAKSFGNDPDGDPNSSRIAGNRNGHGTGGRNSGDGLGGTGQGGVRSLDELKQMPGNARPTYTQEDRYRRRQGNVVFQAYINSAGKPIKFSMSKSSGHPSLDERTLEALKKWKFYPGQEGWVEIPFLWDLKGGPQPMPSLLRRNASR